MQWTYDRYLRLVCVYWNRLIASVGMDGLRCTLDIDSIPIPRLPLRPNCT